MSIQEHGISHGRSQGVVDAAYRFAKHWHGDQKRKYTGEPYITHPVAVAQIVASRTQGIELIAAALLHDVLEDTAATKQDFEDYGLRGGIYRLVVELTDVYTSPEQGNRAERKRKERDRLANVSDWAKTVKLADLIHNTESIVLHDENFAKVYMREKQELLEVLQGGDPVLMERANQLVADYYLQRLEG
jgi:(p)ppGpp synthase/HD superfamily hydrolase